MESYIWLAVLLVALIVEALTVSLVAVWFMPGALIAMALALFKLPLWLQITVFVLSAGVCLYLAKIKFKFVLNKKAVVTNVTESVINSDAVVTEEINNLLSTGAVRLQGKEWSARTEDETVIPAGTVVTVLRIEGVKLIVKNK